jgi:Asp-tRNA(Asn)/Glu-tRNA(Gln) amidotransferase A subunit family amidase
MSLLSIKENRLKVARKMINLNQIILDKLSIIEQKNPSLNALAYIARKEALECANIEKPIGRLSGSTFSTRLSIEAKGLPLSNGSLTQEPQISAKSCAIISRLENYGAICLGKGNIAERGKSYYTDNPRYGRTNHFLDASLSPGGSGGGDAVAVATGMVDFAIGADAGGSVRVPANFCGLYGLSATHGVLSEATLNYSPQPLLRLLKSLGILTRSLEDLEIIFALTEGYDAQDPYSSSHHKSSVASMRKFLVCDTLGRVSVCQENKDTLLEASSRFQKSGFVATFETPAFFHSLAETFVILAAQAQLELEDTVLIKQGKSLDTSLEGPHLRVLRSRITNELPALSASELLFRLYQLEAARLEVAKLFNQIDFIIIPVTATIPTPHNTSDYLINGQKMRTEEVFQFSTLVNALGLPAVAVPLNKTLTGLPTGFQIIGPRHSERQLFTILRDAGF